MTRLAGVHDLAYCFQRVGGAGSSAYAEDWLGFAANIGAAAGKGAWYAKGQWKALKDALELSGKKVLPTPTAIVDVAMVAISIVDLLNGFGPPDSGAKFTSGVDKLQSVHSSLELANPDNRDWSGDASKAYADQNAALQALVQKMEDLDKQMQALVKQQGGAVQSAHTTIAVALFGLVVAQGIALVLYMIPITGPQWSFLWQVVAAFAACMTVFAKEIFTLVGSISISNDANDAALQYVQLAKDAKLPGTFARIQVAGAEETRVSDFSDIINPSNTPATPTVASLASVAGAASEGASVDARAKLSALTDTETPSDGSPEPAPETPADGTTPGDTPAFTPPTLGQLTGQVATISANVAQPLNVVNQTMGSVQQIVSMAQQGQGAAAPSAPSAEEATKAEATHDEPTHEEPAHEGAMLAQDGEDVEGIGAASGPDAGERAPVEVAVAEGEQAHEPGPAQRNL